MKKQIYKNKNEKYVFDFDVYFFSFMSPIKNVNNVLRQGKKIYFFPMMVNNAVAHAGVAFHFQLSRIERKYTLMYLDGGVIWQRGHEKKL